MMLPRPLLFASFCIPSAGVFAQRQVVLIIDTLVTEAEDLKVFHGTHMGMPAAYFDELGRGTFQPSAHPNFIAEFPLEPGLPIELPLTPERGMLRLYLNDSSSADTLRIARYQPLPSCHWDSVNTWIGWYHMDKTDDIPIRYDTSVTPVNKNPCGPYPNEIPLNVNGVSYTIPIRPQRDIPVEVVHFHGHKPRRCARLLPDDKGYARCKRMHGCSYTWRWTLFGELHLP